MLASTNSPHLWGTALQIYDAYHSPTEKDQQQHDAHANANLNLDVNWNEWTLFLRSDKDRLVTNDTVSFIANLLARSSPLTGLDFSAVQLSSEQAVQLAT